MLRQSYQVLMAVYLSHKHRNNILTVSEFENPILSLDLQFSMIYQAFCFYSERQSTRRSTGLEMDRNGPERRSGLSNASVSSFRFVD